MWAVAIAHLSAPVICLRLSRLQGTKALVSCSFETALDLPYTYDISDSIEASSGRPLSDLRNFSRFGAWPFCVAAMAASFLQPGRGVWVGIWRRVVGLVSKVIVLTRKVVCLSLLQIGQEGSVQNRQDQFLRTV